jgi:hypothetical protein
MAKVKISPNYEAALARIEDYVFDATDSIDAVERFTHEHEKALQFICENPKTPAVHPVTGDQSWNFGDGRYRMFFRCIGDDKDMILFLTHIIDNKEINPDVYPNNKIPTYDEE